MDFNDYPSPPTIRAPRLSSLRPVPPRNPAFDEVWNDRANIEPGDLFEDISINAPEVVSALTKDEIDETKKWSRRKRATLYGSLILVLLGLVATIVIVVAPFPGTKSSDSDGTNISGNAHYRGNPTGDGVSTSELPLPAQPPVVSTGSTPMPSSEATSTSTTTTVSPDTNASEDNVCIPNITRQDNLLSHTAECEGCSCDALTDGDTTLLRHNDNIYFYSIESEGAFAWEKEPTGYRGTSHNIQLALSGNVAVPSDYITDDVNRDVLIIEKGSDDMEGVWVLDWRKDPKVEAGFGSSIAIHGNLIAVGSKGAMHLYEFIDGDWHLHTVLDLDNADGYPEHVAVRENAVAITGLNRAGQAAVFVYRKISHRWEKKEEIVFDECTNGCGDDGWSLAFTDDDGLMIVHRSKDALYHFTLNEGRYEMDQEIKLATGFLPDQLVVSGGIAVVRSSAKASLLVLVETSTGGWTIATSIGYSEDLTSASLSGRNLMVSVGAQVLWYTLEGCEII